MKQLKTTFEAPTDYTDETDNNSNSIPTPTHLHREGEDGEKSTFIKYAHACTYEEDKERNKKKQ